MTHMLSDMKYAWRRLLKSPSFTLTAVLTLALGIGANAVVFSVLNGLVLHTLDVPNPQRFYSIEERDQSLNSYPDYLDVRDRNRSFDSLLTYNFASAGLETGGEPIQIWLYETSGNYFDTLGLKPYLGRFFHRSDEHGLNSSPYIVLSYDYWRSHFQADPGVVGRTVQLNKHPFTVLGVAGPDFRGTERFFAPALWVPLVDQAQIEGVADLNQRSSRDLWVIGRLKPGVTASQANTDLDSIAAFLRRTYPKEDDALTFSLSRPGLLGNLLGRPVRAFVTGLMLLAALILLAACANLGSLFAARAADRSREIALRLALGSSRSHVLRQLLTESVLVALIGGAVGIAGSVALLRGLSAWQPLPYMPIQLPVRPDTFTYVVAVLLALASGFIFGMVPVRQVLKADPWMVVKTGSTTSSSGRWFGGRDILLVIQIAVCAVLVTASLVAVRGLVRSLHSNFGFDPRNALLVNTDLTMGGYHGDQVPVMQRRMLDAIANLPGVSSVGSVDFLPLGLGFNESSVFGGTATDLRESNRLVEATSYNISPGYFQAAGTTLLSGRTTTWNDNKQTPKVAVVNREFARRVFGSVAQAIGGYFKTSDGSRMQVVGVVEDGKYETLTEVPRPSFFLPGLQSPSSFTWFVIRAKSDPQALAAETRDELRKLDPGLPLTIVTWNKELDSALFAARMAAVCLGVLGMLGAMLAVTGLFGMASYSVSKRVRELGIRVALGARRKEVLQAALGRTFRLLATGALAGLLLGIASTRVLSYIVYEASPKDPVVLASVIVTMIMLGLLAGYVPARRALAIDPAILLRDQ
ncbi:MAG TPA: ABC transporter permease [Acidobacteriaceae bacterium]|nr:ABC transporter permease [Acidobacteriaceae bacterium]